VSTETIDDATAQSVTGQEPAEPGLVLVYSGTRAQCRVFPLVDDRLEIGRDGLADAALADGRVSRQHALIERNDEGWSVQDLDSRNGTFVDGRQARHVRGLAAPTIRVGRTLFLAVDDRRPYEARGLVVRDGVVLGPAQQEIHERIALVAKVAPNVMLAGGSGSGKEIAARAFHAGTGGSAKPFVAVNCAAIPAELAERMLFGARRGAYTGAVADAEGLIQAADGGTLFLDEIAELDLATQAALLRVLETRQVTPLGAVRPVAVDMRLCAATHRDLRAEVAAGRFREDLYFRIGRPELRLSPLCERREEIPALIDLALDALRSAGSSVRASVEFVEACLLRSWPGNVRELLSEVRTAVLMATGRKRATLAVGDLDDEAGRSIRGSGEVDSERPARSEGPPPAPETIEAALRSEQGNVARAAARLGISRSRLRRIIEREGIDLAAMRTG
jgi:DNA-binding NtrC family response regulator